MDRIELQKGDIFLSRNPMMLGRAINFVQTIWAKDNHAEYSHAGIIIDSKGTTFESLWRVDRQNLWEAYKGRRVLIGRYEFMTLTRFGTAFYKIQRYEGSFYPFHRILLHLLPGASKLSLGFAVCSELVANFLVNAKAKDYWKGVNPDDLHDMIKYWKHWEIVYEGEI